MAIEGLGGTYGIPPVIKEQGPGAEQKKKKQKREDADKKHDEKEKPAREGKIDIRI